MATWNRRLAGIFIALIAVFASLALTPSTAQAGPNPPEGGEGKLCNSWQLSWSKVDGGKTDWWVGKIRVQCKRKMIYIDVQPTIHRSGGGAKSRTYYMKPAKTCGQVSVCTATFKVRDIGGRQSWSLWQEPSGTKVMYSVPSDPARPGTMNCWMHAKFYCHTPYNKTG